MQKLVELKPAEVFARCESPEGWGVGDKLRGSFSWCAALRLSYCGPTRVLKGRFYVNDLPVMALDWHAASGKPGALPRGYHYDLMPPLVTAKTREPISIDADDPRRALDAVLI